MMTFLSYFRRDRRAATAIVMAILFVPLIIGASAAVDISRAVSTRAQLQAAADAAAMAGAGAWQTSESSSVALNTATVAFNGTGAHLSNFIAGGVPAIQLTCTGSTTQCGSSASFATSPSTFNCPSASEYCVVVTASGTLTNSLFRWLIPTTLLNVRSVATTAFPPLTITNGDFTNTSLGKGSDLSGIYAYAVPEDASGNTEFGTVPAPNTNCEGNSANNPLGDLPVSSYAAPTDGATGCNFLEIGSSTGASFSGSLTLNKNQLIAFTFVNFTGFANKISDLDDTSYNPNNGASTLGSTSNPTQYTSEIYVNGQYHAAGFTVPAINIPAVAPVTTCTGKPFNQRCTTTPGTDGQKASAVPVYGYCPAHNLYGSINTYFQNGVNIVPVQDSINMYSSAYEVLGYPPTFATNHVLVPFLGPVQTFTQTITSFNSNGTQTGQTTQSYKVQVVCPQWPTTNTNISATVSASFTPQGYSSDTETVNEYSTYYPGATYSDGVGGHVFPPPIAGCSPVTSNAATPDASTADPWWGWSPSNGTDIDPNGSPWNTYSSKNSLSDTQNCTSVAVNSTGSNLVSTVYPSSGASTVAPFTSSYNNCALLIQPLGNDVKTLPTYWTYTAHPGAFIAGTTGNPENVIGMTAKTTASPSSNTAASITSLGGGTFSISEPIAEGQANSLPSDTSHHCYNPQANGNVSGTVTIEGTSVGISVAGDNNNSTAVDPVENPQDGIVNCNSVSRPSFGLFWNDMGSWATPPRFNDDLGYQNAITAFTCPLPSSTSGGGPVTLSG